MAAENEFVLRMANVNGSGSASANRMIAQCVFRMGIPVGPKNMFPSNIQGLPTWYEIRVSEAGYTGRRGTLDLLLSFNRQTLWEDIPSLVDGGYILYDSTQPLQETPEAAKKKLQTLSLLPLPVAQLVRDKFSNPKVRGLLQNLVYVGALISLIGLEEEVLADLLREKFGKSPSLFQMNLDALLIGKDYAQTHFSCPLPFYVRAKPVLTNEILLEGNQAAALGCLYAGATVVGWYPITPSTSLVQAFTQFCQKLRIDKETGEKKYCIIQAEDEMSALGIVLGAGWNGARAFTATSGPGLSLMTEFLGYAYYAELPAVVFNVQRCGPSTGMPTRNQQADLLFAAYASHGDTQHVMVFPSTPFECFEFGRKAFDWTERLQTPILVMSELEIGMNEFVSPALEEPDPNDYDRGKVLGEAELQIRTTPFHRYQWEEPDCIAPRTFPGVHSKGSYFTRGSGHDRFGRYTEDAALYEETLQRIRRKIMYATESVLPGFLWKQETVPTHECVVCYGSSEEPLREALTILKEQGRTLDQIRIRSFPFSRSLADALRTYDRVWVVEQNRDGQMRKLLLAELELEASRLTPVLLCTGLPMEASWLIERLAL